MAGTVMMSKMPAGVSTDSSRQGPTSRRIIVADVGGTYARLGWIDAGKMSPINPRHLLYMLWATTQHYADFGHQIETLNAGQPLTDRQWREATDSVKEIILRGIGAL